MNVRSSAQRVMNHPDIQQKPDNPKAATRENTSFFAPPIIILRGDWADSLILYSTRCQLMRESRST
jgi:hypothetical protein